MAELRVETGWTYQGYRAVLLENRWFSMVVLPDKGCDIFRCVYKPLDVSLTWSTAWGLRRKGTVAGFLANYEGGWQLVFPNGGPSCEWNDVRFDQHGDATLLPWTVIQRETSVGDGLVQLVCEVETVHMPFFLRRTICLRDETPTITMETNVTNRGIKPLPGMLGEHLVFGPPFVGPGSGQIVIPEGAMIVRDNAPAPPTQFPWPNVPADDMRKTWEDLRQLPPAGTSRALYYVTGLPYGEYRLWSTQWHYGVTVRWDIDQMPYLWYWRESQDGQPPWYGQHYNIGLEPFTSYPSKGLPTAVENGTAKWFDPLTPQRFYVELSLVAE